MSSNKSVSKSPKVKGKRKGKEPKKPETKGPKKAVDEKYLKELDKYMKEHENKLMSMRAMMKHFKIGYPKAFRIAEAFWERGRANGRFKECTTAKSFRDTYCVIRQKAKD